VQITSIQNPLLKDIRRAIAKNSLTASGHSIAESFHLLEEALRSECEIELVLCSESVREKVEGIAHGRVSTVSMPVRLFEQIAATESSQGVMTLVRPPTWELEHLFRGKPLVLVLDGLQDPGNAGAMLRTAEAFGATGAILMRGTASPFNPKAMRASAGSVFRLPLVSGYSEQDVIGALKGRGVTLFAAVPQAEQQLHEAALGEPCAFVVGSEGKGVSARLAEEAIGLRIPTVQVESLNASVAAGIVLYEIARQRGTAG
jgi:TrmH family RNA methyltransferase